MRAKRPVAVIHARNSGPKAVRPTAPVALTPHQDLSRKPLLQDLIVGQRKLKPRSQLRNHWPEIYTPVRL